MKLTIKSQAEVTTALNIILNGLNKSNKEITNLLKKIGMDVSSALDAACKHQSAKSAFLKEQAQVVGHAIQEQEKGPVATTLRGPG